MKKKLNHTLLYLLVVVLLVPALSGVAFAAETYYFQNVSVVVNGTGATSSKTDTDMITVTAGTGTATVSIYNEMGAQGVLSFSWALSNSDSVMIDGATIAATNGTYIKLVPANGAANIVVPAGATVSITGIGVKAVQDAYAVEFDFDSDLGCVTMDGKTVEQGTTYETTIDGAVLTAEPVSGASFLAWMDESGNLISRDASFAWIPYEDMTVKAVFVNSESNGYFLAGGVRVFEDLNEAAAYAQKYGNQIVVPLNDAVLPADTYVIPQGVTLLIPFDDNNTLYTNAPMHDECAAWIQPTAYRTLTMSQGAKIVVNGTISLSAKHHCGDSGSAHSGSPTGPVSFIDMEEGSAIILNDGAYLYAWGYITGEGSVVANSGAAVYENFQFPDFRGGSHSTYGASDPERLNGVFPLNQYYIQNIEVSMTIKAGASESCYTSIEMQEKCISSGVTFIADKDAMFNLTSGSVTKRYDGSTDRLMVELNGEMSLSPLVLRLGDYSINSDGYELPITSNLTVTFKSGTATIAQNLAMLPGAVINVEKNAKCVLGAGREVYIYDEAEWKADYVYPNTGVRFIPLAYAPGRTYNRTDADIVDAAIRVNGMMDASAGYVYTTASGANIYSTGNGKVILQKGTATKTYQVTMLAANFGAVAPEFGEIPVTTAKLKNADGSYQALEGSSGTYNYLNGTWRPDCGGNHSYVAGDVVEPTCTENGYTPYTCSKCGDTYSVEGAAAVGHNWTEATCTTAKKCERCLVTEDLPLGHDLVEHDAKNPTCTAVGWEAYVTCSRCEYTTYQEIEMLEHDWADATCTTAKTCRSCSATSGEALGHDEIKHEGQKATCLSIGWEAYVTCSRCNYSTKTELPALGHDIKTMGAQAATCTEAGWGDYEYCSRCDYSTKVEIPAAHSLQYYQAKNPTCEEPGYEAYEGCKNCAYSTKVEIPATGHTKVMDAAVEATCTATGLTEGSHCGVCNKVLEAQSVVDALGHATVEHAAQAATCTSVGWDAYVTCSRCDYSTYQEIAAKGHKLANHGNKAATCTEDGWVGLIKCDNCDYVTYEQTLPKLGHNEVSHEAKAVTCTESGWDAYVTCTRCDHSTFAEKAALGHAIVEHEAQAATCEDIGWDAYVTCSRCDYSTYKEIAALGHSLEYHPIQAPTCEKDGWNAHNTCKREGCTYSTKVVNPAFGHTDTTYVARAATCEAIGWNEYVVCATCGRSTYEAISALGHDITKVEAKEPTCEDIGWYAYEFCSRCDHSTYAERSALGHSLVGHAAKEPTCTETGWEAYNTCNRCEEYTTYKEVEALGHDMKDVEGQEATCTEHGWEDYKQCSRCDHSTYVEIAPLGHYDSDTDEDVLCDRCEVIVCTNHDFAPATCTAPKTCTVCGEQSLAEGDEALGHDLEEHDGQAATCTAKGWSAYVTCKREGCNHTTYQELEALDHDYLSHQAQEATCTAIGWDAYESCSRCEYTTYKEIAALGHDEVAHDAKASSCVVSGWDAYVTCSRCAYTTKELIPALGHLEVHRAAKAATCTTVGWDAYVTCGRTGCYYSTYAGVISALGHQMVDVDAQAATCTEPGWEAYQYCSREGCTVSSYVESAALGHDEIHHEAQAATCTEAGWEAYDTCSRCSYSTYVEIEAYGHDEVTHEAQAATCTAIGWDTYVTCGHEGCTYTTYKEIAALGHSTVSYEEKSETCAEAGWKAYEICLVCDYSTFEEIEKQPHDEVQHEACAATCTAFGWDAYVTCNHKGCTYTTYEEIEPLGHDVVSHDAKAATCESIGWYAYDTCSRCDYSTYVEIEALGHDEVMHQAQAATCTDFGWDAYVTCNHEGCTYTTYEEIEPLGHDATSYAAKAATCTEPGWYAYEKCNRTGCNHNTKRDIPALGHAKVCVDAQAATCEDIGWDAYEYCTREGCQETSYVEIPALGHKLEHRAAQDATCTEKGWKAYEYCTRCDHSTYKEIPVLGHNEVHHEAQAATCTEIGWDAYVTCERCDYSTYKENPALGHTITNHEAQAATCTGHGWDAYEDCEHCDYTTYEEIEPLGHDLTIHIAQAPTCTEVGWNLYECCDRCDYTTYEEIDELGHAVVHHEAKAATCTGIGWDAYETCERCDHSTYEELDALGHDVIHHEAQAATCTEIGWYAYDTCSRCDYSTYVEIEALGHDEVQHEACAATCTEPGYDAYVDCSRCEYTTKVEIAALGHNMASVEAQEATCTEVGWAAHERCDRCGYAAVEEIPALGHVSVSHEGQEPTCTEPGWHDYETCGRDGCDYTTYQEIEALGHDIMIDMDQEPTCTEPGWENAEFCMQCDYSSRTDLPALGHDLTHHEAQEATCSYVGWEAYDVCSRCDYTTYEEIPTNENHSFTNYVSNNEATCDTDGTETALCNYGCGASHTRADVGSRLSHSYDEYGVCIHCGRHEEILDFYFQVTSVKGLPGDTVEVRVNMEGNPGIVAACMEISYDADCLTLVNVVDTELLDDAFFSRDYTANPYCLRWEGSTASADNTANGTVAILTFQIAEDCSVGKIPVCIELSKGEIYNQSLELIEASSIDGYIEVGDFLPGDANSDNKVNSIDVTLLRRFLAKWENVHIVEDAMDLNNDGMVNSLDVTILRRHLAGWSNVSLMSVVKPAQVQLSSVESGELLCFSVSDVSGFAGDEITVTISIENNPGIIAACMSLSYDNDKLELLSVTDSGLLNDRTFSATISANPYALRWEDSMATENNTKNGVIATLKFRILEDCTPGTTALTLSLESEEVYNTDLESVAFEVEQGVVTIEEEQTVSYDAATGRVSLHFLPEGTEFVLIAAYKDGRMIGVIAGTLGDNNVTPFAVDADEIRVFYLGDNYQPVADCVEVNL